MRNKQNKHHSECALCINLDMEESVRSVAQYRFLRLAEMQQKVNIHPHDKELTKIHVLKINHQKTMTRH